MAKKFEEIASGKLKRLIINMPPRHTKSEFPSHDTAVVTAAVVRAAVAMVVVVPPIFSF